MSKIEVVINKFSTNEWIGVQEKSGVRVFKDASLLPHIRAANDYEIVVLGSEAQVTLWVNQGSNLSNARTRILDRYQSTIELRDIEKEMGDFFYVNASGEITLVSDDSTTLKQAVARQILCGNRVFFTQKETHSSLERFRTIIGRFLLPVDPEIHVIAMKGLSIIPIQTPDLLLSVGFYDVVRKLIESEYTFFALGNVTDLDNSADITDVVTSHYDEYAHTDELDTLNPRLVILTPLEETVNITYYRGGVVMTRSAEFNSIAHSSIAECVDYYLAAQCVVTGRVK